MEEIMFLILFQITAGLSAESDIKNNVAGVILALQHNSNLPLGDAKQFNSQSRNDKQFSLFKFLLNGFYR